MIVTNIQEERSEEDILSPTEIAQELPLNQEHRASIQHWRRSIINILNGVDRRLLIVVGPCSIHDTALALDYGQKLKILADQLASELFIVMRTYFEKPRTITGWKGFLHDPDLDGSHNFMKGIRKARSLLIDLTEMGIPCASELLELTTAHYYADFLTWGCIGARTSSSQPHRQLASDMLFPIGFKNSVDGNINHGIHGIIAASLPQTFIGVSPTGFLKRITSTGNTHCHLVLRGSTHSTNYSKTDIEQASFALHQASLPPNVMVDCSHDNAHKRPQRQIAIFKEVLTTSARSIRGLMLESNLYKGRQKITPSLAYGISVTDPCLDWASTQELLTWAYDLLRNTSF
jgi:3-deoxy-7-phosphoheptulonate synthase